MLHRGLREIGSIHEGTLLSRTPFCGLLALLVVLVAACGPGPAADLPDVVFVTWDSVRADHVSALGYPRPTTPTLESIAAEGVVFERAWAQHNWTWPSYASTFTSLHNWEFPGLQMSRSQRTLAEILTEHGYTTMGFVQNPNLSAERGFDQGFDHWVELDEGLAADEMVASVLEWLPTAAAQRPVFLFVHLQEPHWPYDADAPAFEEFLRGDSHRVGPNMVSHLMSTHGERWDPEDDNAAGILRYLEDLYDADLRRTDDATAALVDGLREVGLWNDSIFVFNSDHGDELGDRQEFGHAHGNLHPELTRVPLILRLPGVDAPGPLRVEAPVRNLDVLPTILDAAGLPIPEGISGRSLLPLGNAGAAPPLAFSNVGAYGVVRSASHSLHADHREGEAVLRLYDLVADPRETSPLDRPEEHPAFAELAEALRLWHEVLTTNAALEPTDGPSELSEDLQRRLRALGYLR